MAFGSFDGAGSTQPMAEINTTPLVDVMLVLLVIFIITAPLFHQAVQIDLPRVDSRKLEDKPLVLQVALDAGGQALLEGAPIERGELAARFRAAAGSAKGAPEMHLRADRNTRYEQVTAIMALAQNAGIAKIAFVTEAPRPASPGAMVASRR